MVPIRRKEMREIQLRLLRYVRDVCERNDLRYFLCGGTLLGAIRHGGCFIPWDDDIDIFMSRPDYETLMGCFDNGGEFELLSFRCNSDYYYTFAKVVHTGTVVIERTYLELRV